MTAVKRWQKFPREMVNAPSVGTFTDRLDKARSKLIYLKMPLLIARALDSMAFKGPFHSKPFYFWKCHISERSRFLPVNSGLYPAY